MDPLTRFFLEHPYLSAFVVYIAIDRVHNVLLGLIGRKTLMKRLKALEERLGAEDDDESLDQRIQRLEAMSGGGPFRVRAPMPPKDPKTVDEVLDDTMEELSRASGNWAG